MGTSPTASRPPPPLVSPVEFEGVRYEQDNFDNPGDQSGGYLAAIDAKSGKRLWRLKVYEVEDSSRAGVENLPRMFASMKIISDRKELEIEDETGHVYRVDLTHRTSKLVHKPGSPAKRKPPRPKPKAS